MLRFHLLCSVGFSPEDSECSLQSLTHSLPMSLSYITTDSQSAGLSWYQAPIWGLWPDFYYWQTIAGLLIWGALSDEVTNLLFTIAAVFASAVILRSESCGAHDHILLSQIWDSPNLEDQVHVFISHRNRVAQLYPQALGHQVNLPPTPNAESSSLTVGCRPTG
jgi:hypothetical protein